MLSKKAATLLILLTQNEYALAWHHPNKLEQYGRVSSKNPRTSLLLTRKSVNGITEVNRLAYFLKN